MPKRKKSELPVIKKGVNGDLFCYKDGKKVYLARDEENAKEKLVRMLEAEIAIGEDAKHSQGRSIAVDRIPAGTVVRVDAVPTAARDRDVPLAADEPRRSRDLPGPRLDNTTQIYDHSEVEKALRFVRERDKTCGDAIAGLIHQFE